MQLFFELIRFAFLSALFGTALVGCAQDPFGPLADAVLGKDRHQQTQAKNNTNGASTVPVSAASQGDLCRTSAFVTNLDVDTAYAHAMRTFGFRTWQQRRKDAERSLGLIDEGFKHDATPGAFYRMADYASAIGQNGKRYYTWMGMELAREGNAKTAVSTRYCAAEKDPSSRDPQLYATMDKLIRDSMK